MMQYLPHLIRPYFLLLLIPWGLLIVYGLKRRATSSAWREICDAHLLPYLLQSQALKWRISSLWLSSVLMIIALLGPSWSTFNVTTYQPIVPRVFVLDMSPSMRERDVSPDRLSRAKFKLHDAFKQQGLGQFGLVVYSGEPFVASPLTEDSETIDALLPMLTFDVMPVDGQDLSRALQEATQLIHSAGFYEGNVLVLTASAPDTAEIEKAKTLATEGMRVSIMPIVSSANAKNPLFARFAAAGHGQLVAFDHAIALNQWLHSASPRDFHEESRVSRIPRDEGRWFIVPALLFLLPVFRRGRV